MNGRHRLIFAATAAVVLGGVIAVALMAGGTPDPTAPHTSRAVAMVDIGVLVFREGLECILVLAAITASLNAAARAHARAIGAGVIVAFAATLATWQLAVRIPLTI